ncbi:MAG: glycosyltransferase, partial [Methanosarcinaceae archaeon]|nr:glycosyltransferase [Methanosarcinaceae archaeon]
MKNLQKSKADLYNWDGKSLIFLISQPRAGSTLLQRILAGHPEIHTMAEPWIMLHPLYALKRNGIEAEYVSSLARQGLDDFLMQVPEGEELYIEALREMANVLYNKMINVSGKKYFLDKTPRYYFIIPELYRVFPKAKFIFLIRNPVAVLSSVLKTWCENILQNLVNRPIHTDLIKGPYYLLEGIKKLKEDAIVVHYEKLVQNPKEVMQHVCNRIGIQFNKNMLEYGKHPAPEGRFGDSIGIYKHSNPVSEYIDKWTENLQSPDLIEFAQKYLLDLGPEVISRMGYSYQNIKDKLELKKTLYGNSKGGIKESSELNQQGEDLFAKDNFDGALDAFTKALDIDSSNAIVHNNLGVLYYNRGDKEKAFSHYKKAAELQPENITFQKNLADFYYVVLGRAEEAMRLYVKILNANPEDVETLLIIGHICVALKKFDDAKDFYGRVLKIEPGNKDARKFLEKLHRYQMSKVGNLLELKNTKTDTKEYLVSAIVSTYNSEHFIRGCLEDLVNQTLYKKGDLEIIVVNSGSEQNEEIIVKEFQKKYDNIKYIKTEQRESVYQAWNRGIKAARGKYITSANTDDRLREDAYEKMVEILANNQTVGVVYADQWISESPNIIFHDCEKNEGLIWPEFFPELCVSVCTIGPQPMWRKDLHSKYGLFDESLNSAGDYEFWARISNKVEFYHIPDFLGVYYRNPKGIESSYGFNQQETILVRKSYNKETDNKVRRSLLYSDLTGVFHKIQIYRNKAKGDALRSDVSVVIPVYNGSEYIIETLHSITDQTASNFEIIVVDDRSTDDSAQRAIRFLEEKDIPSTVMVIPHRGTGVARNIGVFYSTGEFILPFDADDIMKPEMIEKFHDEIANNPELGVVYCDVEYFENKHGVRNMGDFNINNIMFQNQAHAPSMFRKNAWINANGYCSSMKYGDEDWDLWLEMLEKRWRISHVERPLFRYRWREGSRTSSLVRKHWAEMKLQLILNHPSLYHENYRKWAALENKNRQTPLSVREMLQLLSLYISLPRWQSIYWWREAKKRVCSLIQVRDTTPEIDKMVEDLNKIIDQNIMIKSREDLKVEMPQDEDIVVSAILSTYNSEEFIAGCLYNLEQQTISDKLEIIVVNSGSSQNEDKIIKEFVKAFENIKYIKRNNRETIYSSWNRAAAVAKGKYLVNTNTDDKLKRDALEIMANTLNEKNDVGIVYIDQIITEYPNETLEAHHTRGFLKRTGFSKDIIVQRNPCGPQVMWRRKLHELIGYFKAEYEVAGDWDFWLRVVFNTNYTIHHIPELLGLYYYNRKGLEHGD